MRFSCFLAYTYDLNGNIISNSGKDKSFQKGNISKQNLLDWVNTVWFSGLFEYCDENCDCIASVMNELEEIDEDGREITYDKIKKYIYALENNIEI
ncbi:hypothetical protein RBH29_13670 [Herbivorax sp. ANBcel31]|uniref:hypothetical protein n=1 Tax=Herbivorax sp. ANBcel31 TaxID=3069754 RepID=UPI0027B43199|nr:hypothetical protein [Herbivorax sp. ANBcel31]MDQ2087475.1 hypothetical protein [Herbivorax sp. ANBcel31]